MQGGAARTSRCDGEPRVGYKLGGDGSPLLCEVHFGGGWTLRGKGRSRGARAVAGAGVQVLEVLWGRRGQGSRFGTYPGGRANRVCWWLRWGRDFRRM